MRKKLLATALGVVFLASSTAWAAETSNTEILNKLDQILETQKKLIQLLDEIKQELYVVKIRATQQ